MKRKPIEIGRDIADVGALLHDSDEFNAIAGEAARAIREERKGAVILTPGEAKAALAAMSQMTNGNARDFTEWRSQTHGTKAQWLALLRAEAKIQALYSKRHRETV